MQGARRAALAAEMLQPGRMAAPDHDAPGVTPGEPLEREERDAVLPAARTLDELRALATGCRACDLWARATQTVFGDGSPSARLLLVGEQPGNSEDLEGAPFVGPAGRLLDTVLVEAGIDRAEVYVTNVVKHFKWRRAPSGKRRIHDKPNAAQVEACRPWLEAEVARIRPELIVCLGATAAQALLGRSFRVTQQHGEVLESPLGPVLGTIHPSAILRAGEERDELLAGLIADLREAGAWLAARGPAAR